MKANKHNAKFSVSLFVVCLLSTIPVYSEDQSNIAQNVSKWDKCKTSINNSAQFLKKNADYIAAAVIPTLAVLKLFSGVTLEERREHARNLINSYEGSNLFWQFFAVGGWDFNRLNRAHLVERLNDKQLKKYIKIEMLAVLFVGLSAYAGYYLYKKSQYCLKNLEVDLEGKVTVAGEPIIIFEKLGDSNTQSS